MRTNPNGLRVATVADIHGNLMALEAVLARLEAESVDAIVVAGDVASGPQPAETVERLMSLERARFIRGNGDREAVQAFDEHWPFDPADDHSRKDASWFAHGITRAHRDFLAEFEDQIVLPVEGLGDVLFCHGSPGSDEQMMTSLTPELALKRMLAGVEQRTVVCGHTHVQFDRAIDGFQVINAGSVGMAYEGRRGAFWVMLGPHVEFQRTDYDYEQAAQQILMSNYWAADNLVREIILNPPDPREVEEFFEKLAVERGER